MACLTVEVFHYSSLCLTVLILVNWFGHLVYMIASEKHTLDKYLVVAYWTASVCCALMNQLTKSLYFLSLALLFAIQSLVLSVGSFRPVGYILVTYALCMTLTKAILEIVILRYKGATSLNGDSDEALNRTTQLNQVKYSAIMHALRKNRDSRAEVTLLRLVAYLLTIAFFNYCTFRFWKDIFEIPDHAFRPVQLVFPITLLVATVLLLNMIDIIIYRKDHRLIYLIIIFSGCLLSFYLTANFYNFAFLAVYLFVISVIYICKFFYSTN